jgi:hypothetical protein
MLKLLLDEHISPGVADGLIRRNPKIVVRYMAEWEAGSFLGQDDSACLKEAATQGLTLVTYDRRTIPPLLKSWAEEERSHSGVIFVDEKTISPSNIGALVRALTELTGASKNWDWRDRIVFLRS